MKLKDFDYFLPEELIAQTPIEPRDHSKLLILNKESWEIQDKHFYDILENLSENDVLVLNETRTIHARLFWEIDIFPKWKKEVKPVEILLHKQISLNTWECLWYPGKNLKIGRTIRFYDENKNLILNGFIEKVSDMWRFIKFDISGFDFLKVIEKIWEMPLPHYITHSLENTERYQTIYGKTHGSAATPTAWLHFTNELLTNLEKKWVRIEKILLHVWVWTFKPVEVENITEHYMHSEYIEIKQEVSERLNEYKKCWKKIIAVGTTSIRTLESFTDENWILWYGWKETSIFIYPGYKWRFIDSLITNFHLPCSTLLMLVSSLAWTEHIKTAYQHAIENKYRFFSFWDAMWIK